MNETALKAILLLSIALFVSFSLQPLNAKEAKHPLVTINPYIEREAAYSLINNYLKGSNDFFYLSVSTPYVSDVSEKNEELNQINSDIEAIKKFASNLNKTISITVHLETELKEDYQIVFGYIKQ